MLQIHYRGKLGAIAPAALLVALAQTADANQDHVVSTQSMQQQVESNSADRQKNIDTLENMLKLPEAQKAMHDAKAVVH